MVIDMGEQRLEAKSRHIDSFLSKEPKTMQKLDAMVVATNEFPNRQHLFYNLMRLTSDINTFNRDLINYLAEDVELAKTIIEKARLKNKGNNISATVLNQSIQKLGYGWVHNEVQDNLALEYVNIFFQTENTELKQLIKQSLRLAYTATGLARVLKFTDTTPVFFVALNYFLGEMILLMRDEKLYQEYKKLLEKGIHEKTAELASIGFDLGGLSARMLRKWKLPEHIINVVENKENPAEVRIRNKELDTLVRFANYIMRIMGKKDASPQYMWNMAQNYLSKLEVALDYDTWVEEIKLLYIKVFETEYRFFNRREKA